MVIPNNQNENIPESERRLIQKELFLLEDQKEAAEKRFQIMFENALIGLFRGEVSTRYLTDANDEAALTFGFNSVETLKFHVNANKTKYNFFGTMPEPDQLSDGAPYSFSTKAVKQDGTEFWAQFSVRYTGEGKYIEGAVKDITDQVVSMNNLRQAKAEAEDANEAKSRFLATMSHEIRTPLNGIIGFAEIIKERCSGKNRKYAGKILDESDRLMILINQLLDFSKLEANKINLESILFDLYQVLDEAEEPLKNISGKNGLEYSRETDKDLPRWFLGDPMRLRQVISNLLSNAVKFTEEGHITLKISQEKVYEEKSQLRFSVIDTGIGIAEDKIGVVFSRFEQADTSISRRYGGTGLGISICRELVALMGGELNVHSRVGIGSEFYFTITMEQAPETMEGVPVYRSRQSSDFESLKGISVLLVEDSEINRDIARYHLEKAGCRVFQSGNGREALGLIADTPVDLIFMDLHMPEMDGLEATRSLRGMGLTIPIIGMTASAYTEDRVQSLSAGMDDFITKPLRRVDLLIKAVEWVGNSASHTAVTKSSTLRYNEFLEEFNGEVDLTVELFNGFIKDTLNRLVNAGKALNDEDIVRLHREAHSVKSGALNLMADELAENALKLERAAKDRISGSAVSGNGTEELKKYLEELKTAFKRFTEAWKSIQENNETDQG